MHTNLPARSYAHRDTCSPIYPLTSAYPYTRAHSQPMNGLPVGKFLCKSDLIPSSCTGILCLLPQSLIRNENRKDPLISIYLEIGPQNSSSWGRTVPSPYSSSPLLVPCTSTSQTLSWLPPPASQWKGCQLFKACGCMWRREH